jgi:NADPH2:quinone reductase
MGTQAIEVTRFGGPEVLALSSVPEPVAGPGQALVSVTAADVLFLDTAIRSGRATAWFPVRPPFVPGGGVGGRVTAVGDGVDPGWAGRAVIARTGAAGGTGGYAEQAVVPADRLVAVPDGVDLAGATALLHDGVQRSAWPGTPGSSPPTGCWCSARPAGSACCSCRSPRPAGHR